MATEQIDRDRWSAYFDELTRSLRGKLAEIEVASLDLGDQTLAQWMPLIGIAYDDKDDLVEIALESVDHLVRAPRQVFVDVADAGIGTIAIVDRDGSQQIVRFRDPLALAAPVAASRGTSGE